MRTENNSYAPGILPGSIVNQSEAKKEEEYLLEKGSINTVASKAINTSPTTLDRVPICLPGNDVHVIFEESDSDTDNEDTNNSLPVHRIIKHQIAPDLQREISHNTDTTLEMDVENNSLPPTTKESDDDKGQETLFRPIKRRGSLDSDSGISSGNLSPPQNQSRNTVDPALLERLQTEVQVLRDELTEVQERTRENVPSKRVKYARAAILALSTLALGYEMLTVYLTVEKLQNCNTTSYSETSTTPPFTTTTEQPLLSETCDFIRGELSGKVGVAALAVLNFAAQLLPSKLKVCF